MKENNNSLEERLNGNLITLFFRDSNEKVDKKIFNEENKCKYHINTIHDIEKQLSSYNIYHCTPNYDPLHEFGYYYASNGSVLVANASTAEFNYFIMFIPEMERCDADTCKFIRDCLVALKKTDKIDIHQVNGEFFKTYANANIETAEETFLNSRIHN